MPQLVTDFVTILKLHEYKYKEMTTVYSYHVGNPVNIVTLVNNLNAQILVDLDLPQIDYISTVYNKVTECVDVTFNLALSDFNINVLNNLADIILFTQLPGIGTYVVDVNAFNRRSSGVSNSPTVNNDINSGYTIGSMVITNIGDIYICTDNTASSAIWKMLA